MFSVGAVLDSNMIEHEPFSTSHHIFIFQTAMMHTITNVKKHYQIQIYLFKINLNALLLPLTEHLTLKVLQNVQPAAK